MQSNPRHGSPVHKGRNKLMINVNIMCLTIIFLNPERTIYLLVVHSSQDIFSIKMTDKKTRQLCKCVENVFQEMTLFPLDEGRPR